MTTDIHSLPLQAQPLATELATALKHVRLSRHHPDCRCYNYRRDGAGYCTPQEVTWSNAISRLLDQIRYITF